VTIKEIAAMCGVSTQTVSRVINRRPDVSADTRRAVEAAITSVGFQPSAVARTLVQRRSYTLGVIAAGLRFYGVSQALNGITDESGPRATHCCSRSSAASSRRTSCRSSTSCPPIGSRVTTAAQPLRELGIAAVRELLARIRGEPGARGRSITLPTQLIVRDRAPFRSAFAANVAPARAQGADSPSASAPGPG
jgi:DNA-binding LacI/PurR family transcriptional regulator